MTRKTLTEALEELERTDPAVKAAAESYDRTVARITRKGIWNCRSCGRLRRTVPLRCWFCGNE